MKHQKLAIAISTLLATTNAFAEISSESNTAILDPILVNADFRPSEIQLTPISITSISSNDIQARSAQHLEDVLNMAPNVNLSSGASRGHYFQIRGIGERSQFKAPINPSVGLIVDDMDFSRSGSAATLFDIDRVEIL
ncbi:MAG: Plug domain-containing protein, partial [Gammaproteobacteria bacterium]|nr:Plug domain-containing protein [Gammaproteobacteria bacterium]